MVAQYDGPLRHGADKSHKSVARRIRGPIERNDDVQGTWNHGEQRDSVVQVMNMSAGDQNRSRARDVRHALDGQVEVPFHPPTAPPANDGMGNL